MRGDQLARQWRILRTIESKKQGTTVAELSAQEDCSPRAICRDLSPLRPPGFPAVLDSNENLTGATNSKQEFATQNGSDYYGEWGLCEVMSWVMAWRPLQNIQFCSRSRNGRVLPTGILRVFRGRKSECDADMGQKSMCCDGLAWEACLGAGARTSPAGCGTRACSNCTKICRRPRGVGS